jgi:dolichyl-diphosphooligosaccharide--protein glycosyltransferase
MRRAEALAVSASAALMLALRLAPAPSLQTGGGEVRLLGNDAWYHWRSSLWTSAHWPRVLGHDPLTGHPEGAHPGQFGTLYDVLLSTVSLAGGLGDPHAGMWLAAAVPAVLGALVVVPVWLTARTAFNRRAGVAAAAALALVPGLFLARTTYGFVDHHAVEALLQAAAVALLAVAVSDDDLAVPSAIGAALVTIIYVLVWPPAVYFVGLAVIGLALGAAGMYAAGSEDWPLPLLAGAFFGGAVALGTLPFADLRSVGLTNIALVHVAVPALGAAGCTFSINLLDRMEYDWGWERRAGSAVYHIAMAAALALAAGAASWLGWLTHATGRTGAAATIAEAGSVGLAGAPSHLLAGYGLLVLAAVAATGLAVDRARPEQVFVAFWLALTLVMALGQVRTNYYLAAPVAVMAGAAASRLASATVDERRTALAVVVVVLLASPAAAGLATDPSTTDREHWEPALDWLGAETPDPGYSLTDDYPDDATADYGVLTWWDYGHWVTAAGRPAVANPFQQNAGEAAGYLLSGDEGASSPLAPHVRYVMVDAATASSKMPAMAVFDGGPSNRHLDGSGFADSYERTLVEDLYFDDADGLSRHRLVYETPKRVLVAGVASGEGAVSPPSPMSRAEHEAVAAAPGLRLVSPEAESRVKVYERVEGAVLRSDDPFSVRLPLKTNTGRRLVYTQEAERVNGSWEARVPYWTTGDMARGGYRVAYEHGHVEELRVIEWQVREGQVIQV